LWHDIVFCCVAGVEKFPRIAYTETMTGSKRVLEKGVILTCFSCVPDIKRSVIKEVDERVMRSSLRKMSKWTILSFYCVPAELSSVITSLVEHSGRERLAD